MGIMLADDVGGEHYALLGLLLECGYWKRLPWFYRSEKEALGQRRTLSCSI